MEHTRIYVQSSCIQNTNHCVQMLKLHSVEISGFLCHLDFLCEIKIGESRSSITAIICNLCGCGFC